MSRGWAIAASVLLCLPLSVPAQLVSGSTGDPLPVVLALAALAVILVSAWSGRGWWFTPLPSLALCIVATGALLDSTVVETEAELPAARFGFPFDYVEATLSANPPLPYRVGWNPWEDPARLLPTRLLAAYALVLGALGLLALSVRSARRLLDKR